IWERIQQTSQLKHTLTGVCLFLLVLVHPSVSTFMFQIFRCERYHYEREAQRQWWLWQFSSYECLTAEWTLIAVLAGACILLFSIGFPLGVYTTLQYLHSWVKLRIHKKEWDKIGEEDRPYWMKANQDLHLQPMPKNASASYKNLHVFWRNADEDPVLSDTTDLMDVYAWRTSFIYLDHPGGLEHIGDSDSQTGVFGALRSCFRCLSNPKATRHVGREEQDGPLLNLMSMEMLAPFASPALHAADLFGAEPDINKATIQTKHGIVLELKAHWQEATQHGEPAHNITRLSDYCQICGQFYQPYKDQFFFMMTWDMVRRLMQTGIVVAVALVMGEAGALTWAVGIAAFALWVHERTAPFKDKSMDKLQGYVLLNQFVLAIGILSMLAIEASTSNWVGSPAIIGYTLLLFNIGIICYSLLVMQTAMAPAFRYLANRTKETLIAVVEYLQGKRAPDESEKQKLEKGKASLISWDINPLSMSHSANDTNGSIQLNVHQPEESASTTMTQRLNPMVMGLQPDGDGRSKPDGDGRPKPYGDGLQGE
ncbi:hypothetical protein CYMTET_45370, partial [Cymbomonas tetramitiformis]